MMELSPEEKKSLTVLICKKTSPIRRAMDSMNIELKSRRGVGSTLTKVEAA